MTVSIEGPREKPRMGRPEGSLNKATAEVKALYQEWGPWVLMRLVEIGSNDRHPGCVAALKEINNRGFGLPRQEVALSVERAPVRELRWTVVQPGQAMQPPRQPVTDVDST